MTLTSEYAWLYNQYPFTNDPNADLLHPDWWITECGCVPGEGFEVQKPFRPMHFYDEQRMLLGSTYAAGSVVRLTAPQGTDAAWTVIDLLDSELVGAADGAARRLGERHEVRGRPDRRTRRRQRVPHARSGTPSATTSRCSSPRAPSG